MEKCELCKEEITTTFLGKLNGTLIKTGKGETSKKHFICSSCQKENKQDLKDKVSK